MPEQHPGSGSVIYAIHTKYVRPFLIERVKGRVMGLVITGPFWMVHGNHIRGNDL